MAQEVQVRANTLPAEYDDLVADAGLGAENIRPEDLRPPRLLLCQSGSPQRKPDHPKLIPGLNELDLFNSLTGANYGRKLQLVVIKKLARKWMQFGDDLQLIESDIPEGDPRTQWSEEPAADGGKPNRIKPAATCFYDYVVLLPETQEMLAFSFKSTQIKHALKLDALMNSPLRVGNRIIATPPAWARTYELSTVMETKDSYSYGGYNLKQVGETPVEIRQFCRALYDSFKDKHIEIERDTTDAADESGIGTREEPGDAADM